MVLLLSMLLLSIFLLLVLLAAEVLSAFSLCHYQFRTCTQQESGPGWIILYLLTVEICT